MATTSSIARLNPKLQAVFGFLTAAEDTELRNIIRDIDEALLEFAQYYGLDRAGWEGTGLDLMWFPSGQVALSSFISTGIDGSDRVDFLVSLKPAWVDGDFPTEPAWEIEADVYADCQHEIDHKCMHLVDELTVIRKTNPIEAVIALRDVTKELYQLAQDKPIEYWLNLAGDSQA